MPEMPEWAHVWFWMRFLNPERNLTPLPQQGIDPAAMSIDEYEERKLEWLNAGAPTTSASKLVAAMTGTAPSKIDTDDIPF